MEAVFAVMTILAIVASWVLTHTFSFGAVLFSFTAVLFLLWPLAAFAAALYVRQYKTLMTVQDNAAGQRPAG